MGISNPITVSSKLKSHSPTIPPRICIDTLRKIRGCPKDERRIKANRTTNNPKKTKVMEILLCLKV